MFNTHLISDHKENRSTGVASRACAWFAVVGIGLSFVLGQTDPANPDKITATKFIRGAQGYAAFKKAIDELLKPSS